MARFSNSSRPDLRAYIGATGSGKGVSIRQHLARQRPARLIVWDPLDEYGEFAGKAKSLPDLVRAVATGSTAKRFAVRYVPPDGTKLQSAFELFCALAFRVGNVTMLVEELSDVTAPSYAPRSWKRCTVQGRHVGLRIIASSQRPSHVDKDFLGNCTYIRCFTLRYPADRLAMAGALDVPAADLAALRTIETARATTMTYLERDFRTGLVKTHTETLKR